ncbi:hypothetical protein M6B38_203510 [Iris pallida]|uniref:Uncharacterized protein n=1 Tax=Iris pallida TaxID=29817 RepID=A0AAX6E6U2_IRIPA|nr:hypothetical protein M6B38_203510 [Iris pallida]
MCGLPMRGVSRLVGDIFYPKQPSQKRVSCYGDLLELMMGNVGYSGEMEAMCDTYYGREIAEVV